VCPRFSVLCCPGSVEALGRADPPSKESYQMSKNRLISFRSQILNQNRPEGLTRIYFTISGLSFELILNCISAFMQLCWP
jgi:hypothetical protein